MTKMNSRFYTSGFTIKKTTKTTAEGTETSVELDVDESNMDEELVTAKLEQIVRFFLPPQNRCAIDGSNLAVFP